MSLLARLLARFVRNAGSGLALIAVGAGGEILDANQAGRTLLPTESAMPDEWRQQLVVCMTAGQATVRTPEQSYLLVRTDPPGDPGDAGLLAVLPVPELHSLRHEAQALVEFNKELEGILDAAQDEIFVTDGAGITLRVNRAAERVNGLPAASLLGWSVAELEEQGVFQPSSIKLALAERRPVTVLQTTRNGRRLLVTAVPVISESGEIIRVVANSRDLTELMLLKHHLESTEQQLERSRVELSALQRELNPIPGLVIRSPRMAHVMELVRKVAQVDSTVLILGESGVGKNVIARTIHQLSPRRDAPFIEINCGAIPETLLESEMFGYDSGAFTGARRLGKAGLLELAHTGTLFLNELGELPLQLQVKLLHFLQERRFTRVGGTSPQEVNVRIIVATNRDLKKAVEDGRFREDLFYRINVVRIDVPPLRDRQEDIPHLVEHFLGELGRRYDRRRRIAPETLHLLLNYDWPGNVRELENTVEQMVVLSDDEVLHPGDLPEHIRDTPLSQIGKALGEGILPLEEALEIVERHLVLNAYRKLGTTYRVAEALGISQPTVVRKLHKYLPLQLRKGTSAH